MGLFFLVYFRQNEANEQIFSKSAIVESRATLAFCYNDIVVVFVLYNLFLLFIV